MTSTVTPLLLRVADVATLLGCNPRTIYKLVDSGALASVRVGAHALRIPRSALEQFITDGGSVS